MMSATNWVPTASSTRIMAPASSPLISLNMAESSRCQTDPNEVERAERDEQTDFERLDEIARDEEWEQALYSSRSFRVRSGEEDPKLSAMQNTAARPETIQEHTDVNQF